MAAVVYCRKWSDVGSVQTHPAVAGNKDGESRAGKSNVGQSLLLLLLQNLIVQTVLQTAQSHQRVMQLACRESS